MKLGEKRSFMMDMDVGRPTSSSAPHHEIWSRILNGRVLATPQALR